MGLTSSLYTGATGLDSNSLELTVIGDNIANGGTVGFKSSRAVFSDALSQSLMGSGGNSASQAGMGTQLTGIQKIFTQGSLLNTGIATDLAIQGNGLFLVKGSHQGIDGTYYTRAGQFAVDNNGYMVSSGGLKVQGYMADADGLVGTNMTDMQPGIATSPPKASSQITLKANLQADALPPNRRTIDPTTNVESIEYLAWDPASPTATSNFSTTVTVFDSLGVQHQVDIYFRKKTEADPNDPTKQIPYVDPTTGRPVWEWRALTGSEKVDNPDTVTDPVTGATTPLAFTNIAAGEIQFDDKGQVATSSITLQKFEPTGARQGDDPVPQRFLPNSQLDSVQKLDFDFGSSDKPGITQFASQSAASFISQDGFGAGDLSSIQVDPTGTIQGIFTNGQTRNLGQVAIGNFPAVDQLERTGGSLFKATVAAGDPVVGKPTTGGRGAITSGALEQSNVDLSQEFIKMIATQRSFQANSKTINTADALLTEIINLKR